jgi:RNase P/RNase MRP subunit POP5
MKKKTQDIKKNKTKQILDDKLKPPIPTLREKKRYFKIKINFGKKLEFKEINKFLNNEFLKYLGILEFGNSSTWFIQERFNYDEQILVLKTRTNYKEKIAGVLSIITQYEKYPIKFEILRISGTLKGLEKDIKKINK